METTGEYYCAYCQQHNVIFVDVSAGISQSYVEDCQICCQPNLLFIQINEETLDVDIINQPES